MNKLITLISAAALAMAMVAPASAQTSKTVTKAPVAAKPAAVKVSKAMNKVTGTVTKDAVVKGILTIGVPKLGRVSVDTKGAKVRTKDGKFSSVNKITPGTNITASGKLSAKTFKASEITINYIPTGKKPMAVSTSTSPKPSKGSQVKHG